MSNDGRGFFYLSDGAKCQYFKCEAGVPVGGGRRVTMVGEIKKRPGKPKPERLRIYEPDSKEKQ
jgi:hypothetical protein